MDERAVGQEKGGLDRYAVFFHRHASTNDQLGLSLSLVDRSSSTHRLEDGDADLYRLCNAYPLCVAVMTSVSGRL